MFEPKNLTDNQKRVILDCDEHDWTIFGCAEPVAARLTKAAIIRPALLESRKAQDAPWNEYRLTTAGAEIRKILAAA